MATTHHATSLSMGSFHHAPPPPPQRGVRRDSADRSRASVSEISSLLQPELNQPPLDATRGSVGHARKGSAGSINLNGHFANGPPRRPHPPPQSAGSGSGGMFLPSQFHDRRSSQENSSATPPLAPVPNTHHHNALGYAPSTAGQVLDVSRHSHHPSNGALATASVTSSTAGQLLETYGRKTPDPPRGAPRVPFHMHTAHPPSAPPAPHDKGRARHRAAAAIGSIPYANMFSTAIPPSHMQPISQMPPQHPVSAHPLSQRDGSAQQSHHQQPQPPPAPAAGRGSLQNTIASARVSTYAHLTLQQPSGASSNSGGYGGASRFLSNSPSPNSTPIKSSSRFLHHDPIGSNGNSPVASPRKDGPAALAKQRVSLANGPIPIASWPGEMPAASQQPTRSFQSRGGVRASYPSASTTGSSSSSNGVAPSVHSSMPNFPSIMKRGAQLIDALPVTLSPPPKGAHHPHHYPLTDEEFEDVSLVDLDDPTPPRKKRVGSGAQNRIGGKGASAIKKLDLSSAHAFRSPYTRKSFAGPPAGNAHHNNKSSKHDVPLAHEWNPYDSTDEEQAEESKQPYDPSTHGLGGGGGGGSNWNLDIGMAEDANPRFRASMEDAHVIRRHFGPTFDRPRTYDGADNKEGDDAASSSTSPAATKLRGSFFAIYDGHGGRACVDFIAKQFHRELSRKLSTGSGSVDVPKTIESAAARVDAAMFQSADGTIGEEFQECGSTACFAYMRPCGPGLRGRELFVANIGDAQAVLAVDKRAITAGVSKSKEKKRKDKSSVGSSSSGVGSSKDRAISPVPSSSPVGLAETQRTPSKSKLPPSSGSVTTRADPPFAKTIARAIKKKLSPQSMSYPHVASDTKEIARIKAAGGCVFANRVNGCLAVSRAFGDHALKSSGVSCVPYQQQVELTPAHKFLIIGCDGIWDVMDGKQAIEAVAEIESAQHMAQTLVDLAIKKGTTDNVSCMVIKFNA